MIRPLAVLILAAALPVCADPSLRTEVLENGAVVLVKENRNMPVATIQAWFPVGSITEGDNLGQGLSHYVEHMIFKGTETQAPGDFARAVKAAGGDLNAYTSFDRTVFHCVFRSEFFDATLAAFSDVIVNSKMDAGEATKEKFVIVNELKMYLDDPNRLIQYAYNETAWRTHPCRHPIGGYVDQFTKLKPEEVGAYFRRWYVPNHVVLIAVGDFDGAAAMAKMKAAFGGWERRPIPPIHLGVEAPQHATRRETRSYPVKGPTSGARLKIGWHGMHGHHPDVPALDMAALVLSLGDSSRLNRVLRLEKRLVQSISAHNDTPGRYAGHFAISCALDPAKLAEAEAEILREVERLKTELVSADEMARVRKGVEAWNVLNRQDVMSQASALGVSQLEYGSPDLTAVWDAKLAAVTAEQIRDAARRYLVPETMTVAAVVPATAVGGEAPPDGAGAGAAFEARIEEFTLSNGMRVVLRRNDATPSFGMTFAFMAGSRLEPVEKQGVANLVAEMLLRGTARQSAAELAAAINGTGGTLRVIGGRNTLLLNVEMLAADFETALGLASDILANPSFDAKELDGVRANVRFQLDRMQRDTAGATSLRFHRILYGTHPYSRTPHGTAESIAALNPDDLRTFHARFIHPKNCVVAIVGALDADRVRKALETAFAGFAGKDEGLPEVAPVADLPGGLVDDVTDPTKNMGVAFVGFPTVTLENGDRWILQVAENILGGMGGRVWDAVRERKGLAYSAWASNVAMLDRGYFQLGVMAQPDNLDPAIATIHEEIRKIVEGPIGEEELRSAKNKVLGDNLIALQRNAAQAQAIALDTVYGLGPRSLFALPGKVETITAEDVRRVAKQYLDPAKAVVVITRPGESK